MLNEKQIDRMLRKLKRYEKTLEPFVFNKVTAIANISAFETEEQYHQIPSDNNFTKVNKGFKWGGEGKYCWYKGQLKVPEELNGQKLYVRPNIGGYEAMLWVNGKPFGIFATKITYISHGNHYCDMIVKEAKAGEVIDIALEYYAGHYIMGTQPLQTNSRPSFEFECNGIDICVKNDVVADFIFNLRTLNLLIENLEETSYRRADIINSLKEVHEIVYYSPEYIDRESFEKALIRAGKILKEKLSYKNSQTVPFAGLIGHSHMDTAWLWHIDETIKKCARTYSNQLSLMEQYPEYKFIQSSAYHSDMIREHYPDLFEGIKEKVKEGRYEPNGGVWVECDCNIVSGETMIRQFLWGQRFTREHFDYTSNAFWLPDTFGYSSSIPQIMKGCGVDYFLTTKMSWNDTNIFPYDTFYWQGIDGTKVFAHLNRMHVWPEPKTLISSLVNTEGGATIKQKGVTGKKLVAYGFGDGGGGPEYEMIEMSKRVADLEGCPRSEHMLVGDFMKQLEESAIESNTYNGELYLEMHRGTLTNQHTIKRNNRKAEIKLRDLEYLTVRQASESNEVASDKEIRPLLNTTLVNQFHDILPGTCIPKAHDQCYREMQEVIDKADELIIKTLKTKEHEDIVSVINTLPFVREDVVYLDYKEGYIVDGEYNQQITTDLKGQKKLAVSGLNIPSFSSIALKMVKGELPNEVAFNYSNDKLITPFAEVTFNTSGYIESFVDTIARREIKGEGYALNTFLIAEDVPLTYDNWDIDADCELKFKDSAILLSREVVSNGEVECRIRSKYQLTEKSTIEQDMIFFADSPEVRFETVMDWQDDHRFLKTAFDTNILTDTARQEIQYGYIKRSTTRNTSIEQAKFEVCNHKYTDLSESRYGAALLNDCKYGISLNQSQMRLSLHKGGVRPDYRGDKGSHECVYAFLPHNEGFNANSVIKPAYQLNIAPVVIAGEYDTMSFISSDQDNIIIEAIKPCEDNDKAFIVRLYEAEGTYTHTQLKLHQGAKAVYITNMLEEIEERLDQTSDIDLTLRAFEIKTIKIEY